MFYTKFMHERRIFFDKYKNRRMSENSIILKFKCFETI